ncbi:MerC family mercury resistance protein [bacterium]|nr:MerC family mercury resistance protein [bacterium]
MNTATIASPNRVRFNEKNADRFGVAASVLCAIHCALAPILLIFLPTFGKIWAHPASHALVAIFIVPLAAFTLLKGYRKHGKRWIAVSAMAGIFLVLFIEGNPVSIDLPDTVELEITESSEGIKGDTANNPTKPAVLETGLTVQVPLFVKQGDIIKVSTKDNGYLGRAN